jgi:hypothetical protein
MIKWLSSRIFWGVLLILAGVIVLLDNIGVIEFGEVVWSVLAGLGALFFLSFYFRSRLNWWALIPGMALVGLTLGSILKLFQPTIADQWGGAIFLGGISLGFFCVYLADRNNWWALIPAGALLTFGIISGIESLVSENAASGIFFLGLGFTFALVAILPTPVGLMRWAWAPASILLIIGSIILATARDLSALIGPAIIILVGILLVIRSLRKEG